MRLHSNYAFDHSICTKTIASIISFTYDESHQPIGASERLRSKDRCEQGKIRYETSLVRNVNQYVNELS
jgi:hypothetical protein